MNNFVRQDRMHIITVVISQMGNGKECNRSLDVFACIAIRAVTTELKEAHELDNQLLNSFLLH